MKKKIIVPVVMASTVFLSNVALAQAQYGFSKKLYVGIGAGPSMLEPDTDDVAGLDVSENTDTGGHVTLGFDFTRRLTAELQYADLGAANLTNGDGIQYAAASVSGLVYLWNVLGSADYLDYDGLDQRSGLSLYGRVGIGAIDNSAVQSVEFVRENEVQLIAGIGVEYAFDMGVGFRAEYISYDTDTGYAAITALYRFGTGIPAVDSLPEPPTELPGRVSSASPSELPDLPTELPSQPVSQPAPQVAEVAAPPPPPPAIDNEIPPTVAFVEEVVGSSSPTEFATADTDSDGVIDEIDECAATSAGTPVDTFGCAIFNGTLEGVNFLPDSDTLTATSRVLLNEVVSTLLTYPDVRVSVQAHTDNQGSDAFNLNLSRNRAIAVVRYLTSQGIPLEQLQARAFGESQPIADNNTRAGRLLNRRVELHIVE